MTTHIVAILDRSGSMETIRNDAIGGFNTFLREQQELPGDADMTLIQFDNEYEVVRARVPLRDMKPLTVHSYVPRGGTALFDAIGRTLNEQRIALGDGARVVVTILTDGEENASREFTREQIAALVKKCEGNGWRFVFLAANQDAFAAGRGMGVSVNTTSNFAATGKGVMRGFAYASQSTQLYRGIGGQSMGSADWAELDQKLAEVPKADAQAKP